MKEKLLGEMKRTCRPEFLNRIDSVVVFHALAKEQIRKTHQKHYKPSLGRGGWTRIGDQRVLTVICNSEDDVKEVVARLPRIEWDMMVTGFRQGHAIKMLIEDEL